MGSRKNPKKLTKKAPSKAAKTKALIVQQPAARIEILPEDYRPFLEELKKKIRSAQIRASLSVNKELVCLYWQLGRSVLSRQKKEGWGTKVIDRLSRDLSQAFPEMKGFSPRNLKHMRAFAEAYPDLPFVQQVAAQIPWFHNCVLLDKLGNQELEASPARAGEQFLESNFLSQTLGIQFEGGENFFKCGGKFWRGDFGGDRMIWGFEILESLSIRELCA